MLNIRKETEYAIHFLQYLKDNSKKCCSLQVFATKSDISFYFMQKIARKLTRAGLVTSMHGVNGGYSLTKKSKKISLYKIVEVMENGVSLLPCIKNMKDCHSNSKDCCVRKIMSKLNAEIVKAMEKIKITNC